MNTRPFLSLLLALGILVGGIAFRQSGPRPDGSPAPVNSSDIAMHGTAWVPQARGQFAMWKTYGWGIQVKAKAPSNTWVHIPITYPTYLVDIGQKLYYAEFCAKSTHGAVTKPIQMDVWGGQVRQYTGSVAWPADNAYHCMGTSFSAWYEDAGISVLLHFADNIDSITLYKAWIQVGP